MADETTDMLARWRRSLLAAERTTAECTAAADQIAEWIETLPTAVAVAKTDPADYLEADWPDAGIESSTINEALRTAMAGLWAKAGAYRRAADKLHHAILDASSPNLVEAADAEPVNPAATPQLIAERIGSGPVDTKLAELRGMTRALGLLFDDLHTELSFMQADATAARAGTS